MIDLKVLREKPDLIRSTLKKRGVTLDLDEMIEKDKERRTCITNVQELKQQRNRLSEKIAQLKRQGETPAELMAQARDLAHMIKEQEETQRQIEQK